MKTGTLVYAIILVVVIAALAIAGNHASNNRESRLKFEGACSYIGGTVHDDLCIKDGKVVLTRRK